MGEPEGDQSSQVDGGDSGAESHLVPLDAAESDSAVVVPYEPRNRSFDHRTILSIVRNEVAVAPGASRLDELRVVKREAEVAPVAGRRAARAQGAVRASRTEIGVALGGHRDDVTGRTGDGCAVLVDDEVVALEAARNRARARVGFDGALMTAAFERRQGLARSVSADGEDLETGLLILQ